MLDDAVTFEDLVESRERTAAIDHIIFRDDLEPVDRGLLFENVLVVRNAKADPYPVVFESVKYICRHGRRVRGSSPFWARPESVLLLLGTVGRAAAFAFARVLAFATVVVRLAAALSLAGILSFAGMLVLVGVRRGGKLTGVRGKGRVGAVRGSSVHTGHRAAQQAGEGRCEHQGVLANLHVSILL